MNFSFYIYGTPNGYNQYPADNNSTAFQEFAQSNTSESQLTVKRSGQLVYYSYMRRLQEKSSNYLGFCLVFNGVYCRNPKKMFDLFDRAFYDVQLKGEFLKFDKGKANYVIGRFPDKSLEIERIKTFFRNNLENDFTRDFVVLPAAFKVGNGKKTISVKENDIDILAAIGEYDVVYISNNEKSLSELERTQKLLTDLYAEKQTFQQNYSKLVSQKRQYKVVLFLCLIVIGCAIGLFAFNENLQSKDVKIKALESDILKRDDTISHQCSDIAQLQVEKVTLTNKNSQLSSNLREMTVERNNLYSYNEELNQTIDDNNSTINRLQSQNNSYQNENNKLQSKNKSLQNDVDRYKKYEPVTYKAVYNAEYYYKYRCNESYKSTKCQTSSGGTIVVYTISNGYGLTEYGWVKMSNLSK